MPHSTTTAISMTCWRRVRIPFVLCMVLAGTSISLLAQDNQQEVHPASLAPQAGQLPHTSYWEFGMEVTATSLTSGLQATVPVPIEWFDQKVEVLSIDSSENVSVAKIKKYNKNASQLFFRVNRLQANETARVVVKMKIEKLESKRPDNTNQFRFPAKPKGSLRKYLKPSPYIESTHSRIRDLAKQLAADESTAAWDHVEFLYQWVRENIEYEFDETIRTCLEALDTGQGDCEELSSLFIAICRAQGIPARAVWIPGHTYPEFYLEDEEGEGHWFPCQCAGGYAFGEMPETKPILQKGDRFKIPGQLESVRYLQPTIKARDAATDPRPPTWIMKAVEPPRPTSSDE